MSARKVKDWRGDAKGRVFRSAVCERGGVQWNAGRAALLPTKGWAKPEGMDGFLTAA
jgi:hypothetical protein